jgi:hypothetical protein
MMNKLIKLLLIQGLVLTGFSALAESSIGSASVSDPKINASSAQTVLGLDGKPQLFTASGCPSGYVWQISEKREGIITPLRDINLNQDIVNLTVDDFFTVPLGAVKRNSSGAILGGFDERTFKVFCKDLLNPTVRSGPSATITIKMDENTHPRNVSVVNKVEACGDELNNNAGARVLIDAQGCMGDTYWIHPNPAFNSQTDGSLNFWTKYSGPRAVIGNEVQNGRFIAKCKLQYYDEVTFQTVYGFTEGFGTDVKRLNAAPKPTRETYTKFKNGNLKGVSVKLCPEETVELTHTIFEGSTDYTKDYGVQWLLEDTKGSRIGQDQFGDQKVINANAGGTWYIKLINRHGARECDQEYNNFRREIVNIPIVKPIIAGNSQVCPDGANAITVQNVGSLTELTSYKWFVNGSEVSGQTAVSYNATDNAKSVRASYLSGVKGDLGNFCSAPLSDALTITPYTRPEKPTITKISGSNGYCDYNFPSLDLTLSSNNTSLIGDPTYSWKLGNNAIGTNSNQLLGSANSMDGSYTVVITDGNGCTSLPSDSFVIERFPSPAKPVVSNKNGKDAYCDYNIPFNAITLEATNTSLVGAAKYLWSTGSVNNSADITKDGIYSVTVTDANGCTSPEGKYEITKYTRPAKPSITNKDGKAAYCDYTIPFASVTLEANNTSLVGAPKYNWSTGSDLMTSTVTTEGVYSVTITDANDCISLPGSYEIVKQTRPAKPVITRKTGADAYCDYKFPVSDLSLESSNTSLIGDAIYTWNNVVKSKILPVTTEGNYTVKVTDANGCDSESSEPYTITKWTSPAAPSIAIAGNRVNCALDDTDKQITVAFSVTNASDRFSYEWFNTGSNSVISKTNALTSVSSNGTYFAIQTDKNGCFSPKSEGIKVSFVPNPNFSTARISKLGAYGLKAEEFGTANNATAGDFQWKAGTTLNSSVANNIKVSAANNGNGDYSVRRKYAFTVDNTPIVCFSNTVKYTFVGDPDFTGVAIYPNPTSGKVNIDLLDEWKNASVTVYDMVGRPVYTGTLNSDNATGKPIEFDLSSLGSGIYILNIQSSNGSKSYQGKILVNK